MKSTVVLPIGFKSYTFVDYSPVAFAIYCGKELEATCETEKLAREWIEMQYRKPEYFKVVPLYLAPKISDKERDALKDAAHRLDYTDGVTSDTVLAVQLRAIAERLG